MTDAHTSALASVSGQQLAPATLHEAFEFHARHTPAAPAVLLADREISYGELNKRAERLVGGLRAIGVGPEGFVAVAVRRSVDTLSAILAVLKAGAAFVPVDPDDPPQRLRSVMRDVRPAVVLADPTDRHRFQETRTLCLDCVPHKAGQSARTPAVRPDHAACAYYTSGSSGDAKGVVLEHRSVLNQLAWVDSTLLGRRRLLLPLINRLTFAASLKQLFGPWLRGEAVLLLDDNVVGHPAGLLRTFASHRAVGLNCVPHLWEAMLDTVDAGLARMPESLALVCFAGESPSQRLVNRSFDALPGLEMWNVYAATETGISVAGRLSPGRPVRIGRPIPNVEVRVLDGEMRDAGGECGELWVGGPGLSRGYLGRQALTSERFLPDPFTRRPGARLFRTGDLVRRHADGSLEFVARRDRLLKVKGFRIELDEVETAIGQHPHVAKVVVTASRDRQSRERLVAHVVAAEGSAPSLPELRDFLSSSLPAYMIPSRVVQLDALPTTPSGKIDREALQIPGEPGGEAGRARRPPGNELEGWVVKLWREVLGVDSIAPTDDFFEVGGDSLSAVCLVEKIMTTTGAALAPSVLWEAPTPELLAGLIVESRLGPHAPADEHNWQAAGGQGGRDELERWVIELWSRVLGVGSVAPSDDFFELGGDSLSAVLVVEELRHKIGVNLSPRVLVGASTPERLAKFVASATAQQAPGLVAVRAEGSRRPFFFVAPFPATTLVSLHRLAEHLDPERPMYALQSYGVADAPVERLCARYLSEIRSIQPEGPYLLGGQCFGGRIALEIAQRLQAEGDLVSLLAAFDAPPPVPRTLARPVGRGRRWLRNIRRSLNALAAALGQARQLGSRSPRTLLFLYRRRRRWALFEFPIADQYSGPVCLFTSTGMRDMTGMELDVGWRRIAGEDLESIVVPASHWDLLAEPAVSEVADQLNRRLDAAEAGLRVVAA